MTTDPNYPQQPRTELRHPVTEAIDVYDNTRDKYLGRVVNIHTRGLMVMGDQPFDEERLYKLDLHLPQLVDGCNSIHMGVDCIWARNALDNGKHWAGFTIIDASPQVLAIIATLVEQLSSVE